MKRLWTCVVGFGALVALTALPACGGDSNGGGGAAGDAECPVRALDDAESKPVEITFWHSATQALEETLVRLTDAFNASQQDVRVNLVNQVSYEDTLAAYRAGLESGDLPDIVQLPETALQQAIDTQATLPAQACVDADDYDLSDHLEQVVDRFTVDDTLWAMPFNPSTPVLYYDQAAFRQAGLDPEAPPTTLDEVRDAAQAVVDSGYPAGYALKIDTFLFEQLMAKGGSEYVNNANGRDERATEVVFDNDIGREIFTWMSELVSSGLAVTNPRSGPSAADNFFAIGNRQAAMTIDSTAALGTITQVLSSGQYAGVELGVAPMPGPSGDGGVVVGGAALFLVNQSPPEKQAAAWTFAKFLNEPEQVAEWSAGTGYIPTRQSAVDLPVLQQRWAEIPGFRVAYDQLLAAPVNDATRGPVIGDYLGTRRVVDEEVDAIVTAGKDPDDALADAKRRADEIMQDYNERVGA